MVKKCACAWLGDQTRKSAITLSTEKIKSALSTESESGLKTLSFFKGSRKSRLRNNREGKQGIGEMSGRL